jgi:hypothetical protein
VDVGSEEEFRNTVGRGSASFLSLPGMPLAGSSHSAAVKDEAPYLTSLQDLDEWLEKGHAKLEGVAPYPYAHRPRPGDGHGGQLLVRCAHVALLVDGRSDVDQKGVS